MKCLTRYWIFLRSLPSMILTSWSRGRICTMSPLTYYWVWSLYWLTLNQTLSLFMVIHLQLLPHHWLHFINRSPLHTSKRVYAPVTFTHHGRKRRTVSLHHRSQHIILHLLPRVKKTFSRKMYKTTIYSSPATRSSMHFSLL